MDKMTPMDPEYQETPPEWQPGTPGYYGTGRLPKPPRSHTGLIVVLLCVMIVANVITVLMLLTLRMRAVQKNTTVGAETETGVTPTLTAPSGHSVEPTEPRTNGTGTLQISAEDTQTRSAGEIYTAMRPSLALVYADGNGGTAIVMTADGYLITNAHTVSGAESITVQLSDGTEYAAALSGMDESSDLAVLKIEAEGLTAAEFGDSDALRVGDSVVAIGDPLGIQLRGTMTNGIVSAINRDLTVEDRKMTLIQTNAALNNGNSGGPLINCYGQVIGINTVKMSSYYTATASVEGLGFAIPISVAKPIIDELIEKGYVSGRPAIGIDGETLPATYRIYYRLPQGIYVTRVYRNSDAAAKGISEGDIITAINGVSVTTMEQLNRVKNQFTAGQTITLTIYHGGVSSDVEIILMDRANA